MSKCSKCPAEVGDGYSMCPACHAKEVARIHAHDTPDIPELSGLPKYTPVGSRPTAKGKRRFKNEKALQ